MNDKAFSDDSGHIEMLEQHSLTITQFANACNVSETWVVQRVHGGVVCLLYTSPSPRDRQKSRMPSSA